MKQHQISALVVVSIVAAGLGFGGGYLYGQSQRPSFQNLTAEQRQALGGQFRNGAGFLGRQGADGQAAGSLVSGEILSLGDKQLTIKLRDGGSKLVFVAESTPI